MEQPELQELQDPLEQPEQLGQPEQPELQEPRALMERPGQQALLEPLARLVQMELRDRLAAPEPLDLRDLMVRLAQLDLLGLMEPQVLLVPLALPELQAQMAQREQEPQAPLDLRAQRAPTIPFCIVCSLQLPTRTLLLLTGFSEPQEMCSFKPLELRPKSAFLLARLTIGAYRGNLALQAQ